MFSEFEFWSIDHIKFPISILTQNIYMCYNKHQDKPVNNSILFYFTYLSHSASTGITEDWFIVYCPLPSYLNISNIFIHSLHLKIDSEIFHLILKICIFQLSANVSWLAGNIWIIFLVFVQKMYIVGKAGFCCNSLCRTILLGGRKKRVYCIYLKEDHLYSFYPF